MQVILLMTGALLITFFGYYMEIMLWIAICASGSGQGISFGNTVSWAIQFMEMNACEFMIFPIAGGIGGFVMVYTTGALFDQDPINFPYMIVVHASASIVAFIGMETVAITMTRRKKGAYEVEKAAESCDPIE